MKKKNILLATLLIASGSAFGQKLSPNTMLKLNDWTTASKLKSADAETKTLGAFVSINDKTVIDEMERLGVKITNVVSDNQVIATIPYSALEAVAQLDGVKSIQAGSEARLLLDMARKSTKVDDCHSETSSLGSFTGKGIVVGIVDSGFEYCHTAWNDADGNSRVKRIWNQSARSGNAPAKYGYGTEYTTYDEMKAARYDMAATFHGSHVANIAAGGKATEKYYGVAPDADLVLVSFDETDENIINGIQYCFDYAESVGKPCVVNISLGSHAGPHDGTSATCQAFKSMVGPGRIIVGAAGNEGGDALHASKTFTADDTEMKTLFGFSSSSYTKAAYVDVWGDKNSPISVKVVVIDALKGKVMAESPEVSTNGTDLVTHVFSSTSGVVGKVQLALSKATNGRTDVLVSFSASTISENRKVGLVVTGEDGATVHMWNNATSGYLTDGGRAGYTDGDTDCTVGELGGISEDVITAGSYNTRLSYTAIDGQTYGYDSSLTGRVNALSLFSSHGPTVDGRTKPDVTAPGCVLISATSKFYSDFQSSYCAERVNGCYYDANAGTSMASPFVAGTVALWLQANPNLTPADVRNLLNQSSTHDIYTGTAANCDPNKWGAGKLNAYEGLKLAIQTTGISDVAEENEMFSITTDRTAHTAQFFFGAANGTAHVAVYNTLGQQVYAKQLATSGETVDLSSLGSGVFVFKLQQGNSVKSVKAAM